LHKVFVYGSLRQGCGLHTYLSGSKFLGERKTNKEFSLFSLGPFPAMVKGGNTKVIGEVYEINSKTLSILDRVEGHPDFYVRTLISLDDDTSVFSYLLPEVPSGVEKVISGDWLDYLTS